MPAPSAQQIVLLRLKVRVFFRIASIGLLLAGVCWAATLIPDFRETQSLAAMGRARTPRLLSLDWFGIPIWLTGVAMVLGLLSRFGMRFIVPVPDSACPRCGYDLANPTSNTCPECGIRITDQPANYPS